MLEDGLRSAVDQVLGFFETKVGKGTDLFDDLDLLVASAGENDVKFVLLIFSCCTAACVGRQGGRVGPIKDDSSRKVDEPRAGIEMTCCP